LRCPACQTTFRVESPPASATVPEPPPPFTPDPVTPEPSPFIFDEAPAQASPPPAADADALAQEAGELAVVDRPRRRTAATASAKFRQAPAVVFAAAAAAVRQVGGDVLSLERSNLHLRFVVRSGRRVAEYTLYVFPTPTGGCELDLKAGEPDDTADAGPYTRFAVELAAYLDTHDDHTRATATQTAERESRRARPVREDDDSDDATPVRRSKGDPVNSVFAWLLVGVPILGVVIEANAASQAWPALAIVNTLLVYFDRQQLQAARRKAPSFLWGLFLVPVYLWKRADLLRQSQAIFAVWCVVFVLSVIVPVPLGRDAIETTAKGVVTQIVRDQLRGSARCTRVRITSDLGGGQYRGEADLTNGYTVPVFITVVGDYVSVEVGGR